MNNVKMSKKFIYSVAMPLALMFAAFQASVLVACSDDKSVAGGASEETRIIAGLENISIHGRARMVVPWENDDKIKHIDVVGLEAGTNVSLYELDAKTFAKTGVVYAGVVGDSGNFAFENVTLKSPYVLIEAERLPPQNAYVYSVFTDVRDTGEISMDVMTRLEALRAVRLAESGESYAEAKERAKAEVLEAFGIYDAPDGIGEADEVEYTAIISAISSTLPTSTSSIYPISLPLENPTINKLFAFTAEKGYFLGTDSLLDKSFVDIVLSNFEGLKRAFGVPFEAYHKLGDAWTRDYQINELMLKYYAGMLSVAYNVERCTQDKEGKVSNIQVSDYYETRVTAVGLVCRSGNWHLSVPEVEHTMGTMTDARDGREYKTVTIDVGGTPQTWMAENLRYELQEGASCDEEWSFVDGCYYSQLAAMNLDSSYLVFDYPYESLEACKAYWESENSVPYGGIDAFCEESMDAETHSKLDYEKIDVSDSAKYQGVCPDGWRLPRPQEWIDLLSAVQAYSGEDEKPETLNLFDLSPLGNPAGFGLHAHYSIMWLGQTPDFVPDPSSGLLTVDGAVLATAPAKVMLKDDFGYDMFMAIANQVWIGFTKMDFSESFTRFAVRCVKN